MAIWVNLWEKYVVGLIDKQYLQILFNYVGNILKESITIYDKI